MYTVESLPAIRVLGLPMRTSNERAFEEIPAHWQRFFEQGGLSRIPAALSAAVFAVYTGFENEGRNNEGIYTLVIGAQVPESGGGDMPEEWVSVSIPSSRRAIFPLEPGHPERVGEAWRNIWALNLPKTFLCDYERYDASGDIHIFVGLQAAGSA